MKKILAVMFALLLLTGCGNKKEDEFKKLEESFTKAVSKYYEENLLGQVYPPYSCQKITLSEMKDAGVSTNDYTNKGCKTDTVSAFIIVTDSSNPSDIKYEVIPNLSCKDYSSTISDETISKHQCLSTYLGK